MRKNYLSAPLPFVGQKRMFAREFIKVLEQYPEDTVFVDLFGGSGLLSHIAKCQKPNATVVYSASKVNQLFPSNVSHYYNDFLL